MSETFSIRVDGSEVARVSGEGVMFAQRLKDRFSSEFVDDDRMLKLVSDGKTIFVLYVHPAKNVKVERVSE